MTETELERHEGDDTKDGWYLLAYGHEYFVSRHNRVEFVDLEYRLSSLAWPRGKIAKSVDAELTELCEARESGSHRVTGWEGESDMMLDESTYGLDTSTRRISTGVIVVAAVAALESLMNRLLDQPGDEDLHREEMPGDLRREFAGAALTVLKGDLNYRRLVGDRLWHPTVPFAGRTAHFPGPVAALRTLKSDVVVGLERGSLDALERSGAAWRTSGTHGLVHVRP